MKKKTTKRAIFFYLLSSLAFLVVNLAGTPDTLAAIFTKKPDLSASNLPKIPKFAPDKVLVGFKPGTPASEKSALHSKAGAKVKKTFDAINVDVVSVSAGSVLEKIKFYQHNPNVKYAHPDYYRIISLLPGAGSEGVDTSDPLGNYELDHYQQQWAVNNTGQNLLNEDQWLSYWLYNYLCDTYPEYCPTPPISYFFIQGASDEDINAPEAWTLTEGDPVPSAPIVVGILDSGIDTTNQDIPLPLFESVNYTTDAGASDSLGHGTHVAGIVGAIHNNSKGIAGIAKGPVLANLKVCSDLLGLGIGICPVSNSTAAILHATSNNYAVINLSYGSDCSTIDPYDPNGLPYPSDPEGVCSSDAMAERDAIATAIANDVVVVVGAGNSYSTRPFYPAAYPNVISVGSTDRYGNLSSFSEFGDWVSVLAPGTDILSTYPCSLMDPLLENTPEPPEGCVRWLSGTSMASPHVAGIAAMVRYHNPALTSAQVSYQIQNCADKTGPYGQNFTAWSHYGRVNFYNALAGTVSGSDCNAPPPPPPPPPVYDPNAMYLYTISYSKSGKPSSPTLNITVNVRRDSNANGVSETSDAPVVGASITQSLCSALGLCNFTSGANTTDANGNANYKLNGTQQVYYPYTFTVSGVTYPGYSWSSGSSRNTTNPVVISW